MSLFGIKDSANITMINNKTNKQVLFANYANKFDVNFSSSPVYALKKGVKSISWDGQREGTITASMQVFDLNWIALLMGSELKAATTSDRIASRKVVEVANATGTFTGNVVAGSLTVFKLEDDKVTHASEYTVTSSSTIEAGKYKIASSDGTNTLTFASGETGNFVVYFLEAATTTNKKFTVKIDEYPEGYSLYADTECKADGTGVKQMLQFYFPNVKPQSNLSLSFDSENAATLDITFDILNGTDDSMMDFTTL